jgi:hypothetical protein
VSVEPRLRIRTLRFPKSERLRDELTYRPLLVVVGLGVALRVLLLALYFPAVMQSDDSPRFARAVAHQTGLFDDYWMPAGYPAFLKIVRHISNHVWVSIAVQHLLGVATALVVYLALRHVRLARPLALVAAGVLLLSGDLLYLEHILMADQFLFMFAAAACCAGVVGLFPRVDARWLALAGALAAAAMLSRSVGAGVVAALAVTALIGAGAGRRRRALACVSVLAGAAVITGLYVGAFELKNGRYLGLSDMRGWNLYSRVAPLAKCSAFRPPAGTRILCERTPPRSRLGPFYYVWDPASPSMSHFKPENPSTGGPLLKFAEATLVAQPGNYLDAVGTDLLRYVEPSIGLQRGYSGQGRDLVWFGFRDPAIEAGVTHALEPRYTGVTVHAPGEQFFAAYQNLFRVDRLVLLAALLLAFAGVVAGRGAARLGASAFGLSALALYVVPTATVSYDFRYGIPPTYLLAVAAICGVAALMERGRARSRAAGAGPPTARLDACR